MCPLTLTDVHSLAQTNELLSFVSACYERVTWMHCAALFPSATLLLFSGIRSEWAVTHMNVSARRRGNAQGHTHIHTHTLGAEGESFSDFISIKGSDMY